MSIKFQTTWNIWIWLLLSKAQKNGILMLTLDWKVYLNFIKVTKHSLCRLEMLLSIKKKLFVHHTVVYTVVTKQPCILTVQSKTVHCHQGPTVKLLTTNHSNLSSSFKHTTQTLLTRSCPALSQTATSYKQRMNVFCSHRYSLSNSFKFIF